MGNSSQTIYDRDRQRRNAVRIVVLDSMPPDMAIFMNEPRTEISIQGGHIQMKTSVHTSGVVVIKLDSTT